MAKKGEETEQEESIGKKSSVKKEPELSVQELMKQEAAKRRTKMGYDQEDIELEEESVVKKSSAEKEPELSVQEQQQSNLAKDSVVFGSGNDPKLSVTVSDIVDPITQAIRDEVITTQQLLLQQEIARGMEEGSAKEAFQKQDLTALRAYLASEKGREAVAQVMQNPEMQSRMHAIEHSGYKTVHSKFQDSFRNVDWGQLGANKIRTTNITNDAGESVCTLRETTVDTGPTNLALDNGKLIEVRSYRQIDFPKELETKNGPMHVSMALKDENGRNMPEKDAVYFTAHYDDSGKLTEVSSPVPVKFMGKGDDAIGYIERDGKVFTLPVTQGKYREMMREVAKNQGMNVDISQSVAETQKQAQDKVTVIQQPHQQQQSRQTQTDELTEKLDKTREKEAGQKPITDAFGKEVDPKIAAQVEQTKSNLGYPSGNASNAQIPSELSQQQVEMSKEQVSEEAVNMLSGKTDKKAREIISTAAKEGKADLVAAMVVAVSNPPEGKGVPAISSIGLKMVYEEAMSNRGVNKSQKARIERACGKIAPKAGIADHAKRVSSESIAR